MTSKELLPIAKRLSVSQVNELEGFRVELRGSLIDFPTKEKLLEYHKALLAAEEEIAFLKHNLLSYETN